MNAIDSLAAEAAKWGAAHLILRNLDGNEKVIAIVAYANDEAAPMLDRHLRAFEEEWDASE